MLMNLKSPDDVMSDEQLTHAMRTTRNQLLGLSDWRMLSDAPDDHTEWATWRQAMRDFPATWDVADTADFPDPPAPLIEVK